MKPITIIGAGNSGFAMAAHLISAGNSVRMWNRPEEDMFTPVRRSGGIRLSGVLQGQFMPDLMTDDMARAIEGVELILVTVPANAHPAVISAMAPYLEDGQTVVLNPGRTCGALESRQILRQHGSEKDVTIAETQTVIYTCRKIRPDSAAILTFKRNVLLAALDPSRTQSVIDLLPACIRGNFVPASSALETSLGNVGMILHCTPTLLNIGWIETKRTRFKYYYEGITRSVAAFLERLDAERIEVGRKCGMETPSVSEWMKQAYNIEGDDLYECIQANTSYAKIDAPKTLRHRYLYEDVPAGLVPLEAVGRALGLAMTLTSAIIDLANQILAEDFRKSGRSAAKLGLTQAMSPEEVVAVITGRK